MITTQDIIWIIELLHKNGILIWLTGGWGIDALLGYQNRDHKDLDILLQRDDLQKANCLFINNGYFIKEIWSENHPIIDQFGNQIDTAFVLHDSSGREIDIHAFHYEGEQVIPDWDDTEGIQITKAGLEHTGSIAGVQVCCVSPQLQFLFHTGYTLPDYQVQDLQLLKEKYP